MPHGKLAMDINSSSSSSDNGRFNFCTVFEYLSSGKYPENFDKKDKLALRKRSKFFICRGQHLFYVGGSSSKCAYQDKQYKIFG